MAEENAQERAYDYVIVGSGINALVAAALLGKKGHRVLVLERNDRIGGCLRTESIMRPGFIHDVMATTFVLFVTSPGYAELAADLGAQGLEFAHADFPTGVLLPNGEHAVFSKDRARNVAMLDRLSAGDGAHFDSDIGRVAADAPFLFSLLGGSLWSFAMAKTILREGWRRGFRQLAAFFGEALVPARGWLESRFTSPVAQALWAPWVLHCGLGPEAAYSGQMAKVVAFALEAAGAPIVKGGAQKLLDAFAGVIGANAGEVRTRADVAEVLIDGGRAFGVKLADGTRIAAAKGVICSVTPNQLYGRLVEKSKTPAEIRDRVTAYRYGKGNMQIHYALNKPPQWYAPELGKVALLHLTPGLDGVSKAANEAERGMLPKDPTVCVDPRPRGRGDPLDTASRSAASPEGRCGGRNRRAGRRWLERRRARALRRPDRSPACPPYRRLQRIDHCPQVLFARRPAAAQRQPRRRRSLRRVLRHRPILPVAAIAAIGQPSHPYCRPLPYRCVDPSRARTRRRLRLFVGEVARMKRCGATFTREPRARCVESGIML
jgi:phytoene dehydrogenase-like protein